MVMIEDGHLGRSRPLDGFIARLRLYPPTHVWIASACFGFGYSACMSGFTSSVRRESISTYM